MTGLCGCGCGRPTLTAKRTNAARGQVAGQPLRYLVGHRADARGAKNWNWRGGRSIGKNGYVLVTVGGRRVLEHVAIAERALGKRLPSGTDVHHVDGDRARNVGGNLVICQDKKYHGLLHHRQRALDACGDPKARPCHFCHSYERQEDITISTRGRDAIERAYHRSCARQKQVDRARRAQGASA